MSNKSTDDYKWERIKKETIERNGYVCSRCGGDKDLNIYPKPFNEEGYCVFCEDCYKTLNRLRENILKFLNYPIVFKIYGYCLGKEFMCEDDSFALRTEWFIERLTGKKEIREIIEGFADGIGISIDCLIDFLNKNMDVKITNQTFVQLKEKNKLCP